MMLSDIFLEVHPASNMVLLSVNNYFELLYLTGVYDLGVFDLGVFDLC